MIDDAEEAMPINVLSVCDGISVMLAALLDNGTPINRYVAYEIDDLPAQCSSDNFDFIERHGDMLNCNGADYASFDILAGGTPCQDISVARANRKGLRGEKSALFYKFFDIWVDMGKPTFLFENVGSMSKEDEATITQLFGVAPIKVNSLDYAPAMRNRYYWTNIVKGTLTQNPKLKLPKPKILQEVLVEGFVDRTHARALLASDSRTLTSCVKMIHRYYGKGFTTVVFKDEEHMETCKAFFLKFLKDKTSKQINVMLEEGLDVSELDGVRYLKQEELEACQTMPQGYTKCLTRNQAAHVLGNGWTKTVIIKLLRGELC